MLVSLLVFGKPGILLPLGLCSSVSCLGCSSPRYSRGKFLTSSSLCSVIRYLTNPINYCDDTNPPLFVPFIQLIFFLSPLHFRPCSIQIILLTYSFEFIICLPSLESKLYESRAVLLIDVLKVDHAWPIYVGDQ